MLYFKYRLDGPMSMAISGGLKNEKVPLPTCDKIPEMKSYFWSLDGVG